MKKIFQYLPSWSSFVSFLYFFYYVSFFCFILVKIILIFDSPDNIKNSDIFMAVLFTALLIIDKLDKTEKK
jgi:hypothetical protein